jgi:hypothetical protein
MKSKTKELLKLVKDAKFNKAYNFFVRNNSTKYNHVEWYAHEWARSFVSVVDTKNFPERREVYR